MVFAIAAGLLLTAGIVAVIEWSYSVQPRSDWVRVREALRRAVTKARRWNDG